jgi:hypothetical protein
MSLRALWLFLPLVVLAALLLVGCPPQIGKSCTLSTDCSQLGDRLCDTSQPNGYCTVFNCEPDSCPNAICVAFQPTLDPACGTADDGRWPRFQRTFCLAPCSDPGVPGDCRSDGYECVDLSLPANQVARRAQVIDTGANDGGLGYMVCMVNPPSDDGGTDAGASLCDCTIPCPHGKFCAGGYCFDPCTKDSECASGYVCDVTNTADKCADGGVVGSAGGPGGCVPAVCLPPDGGFPTDGGVPWTAYNPDAGP